MPETHCHLNAEVSEAAVEVLVLAAGGSQRRQPPRIRLQDAPDESGLGAYGERQATAQRTATR
jgi:hypothetical protein